MYLCQCVTDELLPYKRPQAYTCYLSTLVVLLLNRLTSWFNLKESFDQQLTLNIFVWLPQWHFLYNSLSESHNSSSTGSTIGQMNHLNTDSCVSPVVIVYLRSLIRYSIPIVKCTAKSRNIKLQYCSQLLKPRNPQSQAEYNEPLYRTWRDWTNPRAVIPALYITVGCVQLVYARV